MMAMLIYDPNQVERLKSERERLGLDRRDEVWDGVYVMSPLPNNHHQRIVGELQAILLAATRASGGGMCFPGANISDRNQGWILNYREPDLAVFLDSNPAKDHGSHWEGGPDFVVEILSPDDPARSKRDFYARIGVREFLIVDRNPWALELYRLRAGNLELAGNSTLESGIGLISEVLPLGFRAIVNEEGRPAIEVVRTDNGERWIF